MSYTTATITKNEPLPDGRARIFVQFSGDAGEVVVERDIYVDGSTTVQGLKAWAIGQRDNLNNQKNVAKLAALQPGQSVDLSAITPPAKTAKENFRDDVRLLDQMTRAITLGAKTAQDSDYVAQLDKVKAALGTNPSWVDSF